MNFNSIVIVVECFINESLEYKILKFTTRLNFGRYVITYNSYTTVGIMTTCAWLLLFQKSMKICAY